LYFNGRPVSGGTVAEDGSYKAVLFIEGEGPGKYPVVIRLRYGERRVLGLFRYESLANGSGLLTNAGGSAGIQQMICIVPEITPLPSPTSGVIVFPPRSP
jgi:hypothetical protein